MTLINSLMLTSTEIGCFNTAYLCEEIPNEYLSLFSIDCFNFYKQSLLITSHYDIKNPTALLKMGHYYFHRDHLNESSIEKAVDYYTQSYLNGEPEVANIFQQISFHFFLLYKRHYIYLKKGSV